MTTDYRAVAQAIADKRPDPYGYSEADQNVSAALDEIARDLAVIFKKEDVLFSRADFMLWSGYVR